MTGFDSSWSCSDLAHNLCDILVKKGQLKEKPAFIRTDREAKILQMFEGIGLDGAKMSTFDNPGPLEMMVRKSTNGETWVQHVLDGLTSMLPEDVAKAQKTMTMDETAKEELAAAKERSAQRRERMHETEKENDRGGDRDKEGGDRPKGKGKSDRPDRERNGNDRGGSDRFGGNDRFARDRDEDRGDRRDGYKGEGRRPREGGAENMEKGKGRGKGYKDRAEQQCFNCKQYGHRSRDCPEPPDEELVRQRLAAKAEKERKERGD
mmetsp:Transcript_54851/g.128755  ORF Transcript_54851/g.128755 Transcript_54851/m.128755 type:complete len:264 (+) Transcript_54851:58-849(+)